MVGPSMGPFRSLSAWAAGCVLFVLAGIAGAQSPNDGATAASLFDRGVQKFKQAEYAEAADAFLRADESAHSTQALLNAITAGRRGHAHLLVARAAERALARADSDAELKRLAREALTEAAAQLAKVELSCAPAAPAGPAAPAAKVSAGAAASATCAMKIDDGAAAAGSHYLLPGTHRFHAAIEGGGPDEQPLTCNAGATYTVVLRPSAPPEKTAVPPVDTAAPIARGGLPPAVAIISAGVTMVMVGLTVWSGLDTFDAKKKLPEGEAPQAQIDDVLSRALRTDVLLIGAGVAGVATAVMSVWFVAWDRPSGAKARVVVAPVAGGAHAALQGRF